MNTKNNWRKNFKILYSKKNMKREFKKNKVD